MTKIGSVRKDIDNKVHDSFRSIVANFVSGNPKQMGRGFRGITLKDEPPDLFTLQIDRSWCYSIY